MATNPSRRAAVARLALRTTLVRIVVASAVACVLLMAGLSIQMSLGQDPALGPKLEGRRSARPHASARPAPDSPPSPAQPIQDTFAPPQQAPPPAPVVTSVS